MNNELIILSKHIRAGLTEEIHYGNLILCNEKNIISDFSSDVEVYLRSCLKPIQCACIYEIIKEFNLNRKEIAIICGSHEGEKEHIETVKSILRKGGLNEKHLKCPAIPPLSANANFELLKANKKPQKIHNNCSGKHAGMLLYSKLKGYNLSEYTDINGDLSKDIITKLSEFCEYTNYSITKDGCGLPVISTPLFNLAKGFFNIQKNYPKIFQSMKKYPFIFGGKSRFDSLITKNSKDLIAKTGAGNIGIIFNTEEKQALVIKLFDNNTKERDTILYYHARQLDWLKKSKKINLPQTIETESGEILGKIEINNMF